MPTFKFLHAADIHLDSPLRGLSRYEGVPVDEIRLATRAALNNLVDAAIAEEVAFVVIAGDLYDGDWPHFGTGLFFCAAMGRLAKAGIDVFLLYGNHDAESVLTKKLPLPPNVHAFPTRRAASFTHEATGAVLHGWSYWEKDTRDNLAAAYPAAQPGRLNIGVLHTALAGGRPPHAPYAPCTPQELAAKGYDYWALGHVHDFELVSQAPMIVFPGNLQGRNIREVGPKGAVLVTVQDDRIIEPPTRLALDAVRWARADIDAAGIDTQDGLHRLLQDQLRQIHRDHAESRPLMVRVILAGETSLHGDLSRRREALREEVRGIAVAISDELWIEKVQLRTSAPGVRPRAEGTVLDELAGLLAQGRSDAELAAALQDDLADFMAKTPPDLAGEDDLLAAVRGGDVATLLADAAAAIDARLATEAG